MPLATDSAALAALLPGTWRVGATNSPRWLTGNRQRPQFRYELSSADPLVLDDVVSYTTGDEVEKTIVGVDRLRADGFVWRGRRWRMLVARRWSVIGATEDSNILVIRFADSRSTPARIDVLVRDGLDSHAFRTEVAGLAESLGLSHGEFASLTWLELAD
jgi:hypothetical protein